MVVAGFGAKLRELRNAAKLSQKDLADKAGIALSAIGHLEAGRRSPTWETVIALCVALGVECTAFTMPPGDGTAPKRGRPKSQDT